jgi:hypothetical protein
MRSIGSPIIAPIGHAPKQVWTPPEIEEWSGVPNAFITTVVPEGIVLYERQV